MCVCVEITVYAIQPISKSDYTGKPFQRGRDCKFIHSLGETILSKGKNIEMCPFAANSA